MAKYDSRIEKDKLLKEKRESLEEITRNLDKESIAKMFELGLEVGYFEPFQFCDELIYEITIGEYNYQFRRNPNALNKKAIAFANERNRQRQALISLQKQALLKKRN